MKKTFYAPLRSAAIVTVMSLAVSLTASAQEMSAWDRNWYVGAGTGFNYSTMRYSNLDEKKFPTKEGMFSPIYSFFVQGEFGANRNYVIRPQLSFLSRSGKLKDIAKYDGYTDGRTDDQFYKLSAKYLDIRLPLLYQFNDVNSSFRPYAGLTATLGFALSGKARLQTDYKDNSYAGYQVDLSSKNFSSTYFALAPTVGMRFNFHTGRKAQNVIFAAVEASYEIGLSDTYGGDEKDGKLVDAVRKRLTKPVGTRKFSGFNMQVLVGIPFSAFKKCKETPAPAPKPVVMPERKVEPPVVREVKKEKPCYTLDEIETMIANHENVFGKTICAVDMINFDFGKSTIKPESYGYLYKVAQILKRTNSRVIVRGHTDNVGSDAFNLKLSKKRAQAVVRSLEKNGVDGDRISYEYYGASLPLKSNDTDEGRTYNRRVEFELQK